MIDRRVRTFKQEKALLSRRASSDRKFFRSSPEVSGQYPEISGIMLGLVRMCILHGLDVFFEDQDTTIKLPGIS